MKIAPALCFPALLLAGTALAAPGTAPYRALGAGPDWALTIDNGLIRYIGDGGQTKVTVAAPAPRPSFNGLRYVTPRITVDITHARCTDAMSDSDFTDRVMVTVGRRTVRGCGGAPIALPARAAAIEGNWQIEAIGGHALRGGRPATIAFSNGRVRGNGGCNSFGGGFSFDHGSLKVGPLISTKMACPGPAMIEEQAIMRLLGQPLSASTNNGGKLVLSAGGPRTMVLVRTFPETRR